MIIYIFMFMRSSLLSSILLHEWLVGLASRRTNCKTRDINEWSDQLVQEVTSVSNVVSRAVDFFVDSIL